MFKKIIGFEKICIVGTGAIGSAFGVFLSNAGYKITFIEQNEDMIRQVKENGLSLSGVKEIHLNNVTIVPQGSITQKQDLIIFAVKAYSLEEAVKCTLPMIGKNTSVVCLQNGLEISEVIRKYVSKDQIIEGVVWFPATMVKPGKIELLTFYEESILGGTSQRSHNSAEELALVLTSAGIPTKAVENITPEIWRKAIPIIAGNSINAITRTRLGVISEIPELKQSLFAVAQESLKIAKAEGIELNEVHLRKSMLNALEKGYEHKTSMLIDIINKRKTEVDFLNGKIIELGKKHNIQTPLNLLIYGLIKALEGVELSNP
jgi:2-dehydropantoate 2-reductase